MASAGGSSQGMPYGIPTTAAGRRTSYAAAVSGTSAMNIAHQSPPNAAGGLSHLMQQSRQHPRHHSRNPSHPAAQSSEMPGGHSMSVPTSMSRPLGRDGGVRSISNPAPFIIPSFLQNSRYVEKLEEAHRVKLATARAATTSQSGGNTLSRNPSFGSLPKSKLQPHQGVHHEVVEMEIDDDADRLEPLPSRWSETDKFAGLDVSSDGLDIKLGQLTKPDDHKAAMARADYPMPPQCGIYYYEVTITPRPQKDSCIAVGFCSREASHDRPPGWDPDSWGYHGDDGQAFSCHNGGKMYGQTFGSGDTVGCGVNFRTATTFFTKNGYRIPGSPFDEITKSRKPLYPSIGFRTKGEAVRTNFGQKPFVFDIDTLVKQERAIVEEEIQTVKASSPRGILGEPELIHAIIGQYLQHEGYIGAAKAFTLELESEARPISGDSPMANFRDTLNDPQLGNRQQIKDAILEGNIDDALRLTSQHFPKVLPENESIYFKLRCRRFLEMMRETSELYAKAHPESVRQRQAREQALVDYDDEDDDAMMEDDVSLDEEQEVGEEDDTIDEHERDRHDVDTDAYDSVFEQEMELDEPEPEQKPVTSSRPDRKPAAPIQSNSFKERSKEKRKRKQKQKQKQRGDEYSSTSSSDNEDDDEEGVGETKALEKEAAKVETGHDDRAGADVEVPESIRLAEKQYKDHSAIALIYGGALGAEFRQPATSNPPTSISLPSSFSNPAAPHPLNARNALKTTTTSTYSFAAIAAEVQQGLADCFALMAYLDPLQSDVGERLLGADGTRGREELAEDVNSAILVGMGRGRRSALEVLVGQMEVLVGELGEEGGAAALVNVGRDYLGTAL